MSVPSAPGLLIFLIHDVRTAQGLLDHVLQFPVRERNPTTVGLLEQYTQRKIGKLGPVEVRFSSDAAKGKLQAFVTQYSPIIADIANIGLDGHVVHKLLRADIPTITSLCRHSAKDLLRLSGFNRSTLANIRTCLASLKPPRRLKGE